MSAFTTRWGSGFEPSRCGCPDCRGSAHAPRCVVVAVSIPQLSARGLTKSFGGRAILKGADLEVAAGSRIGILGPNGGGKSTFLRILAGLEHADVGEVTLRRGSVLAHLPQIVDGDERDALATVRAARPELAALED